MYQPVVPFGPDLVFGFRCQLRFGERHPAMVRRGFLRGLFARRAKSTELSASRSIDHVERTRVYSFCLCLCCASRGSTVSGGQNYADLRPAISICLLNKILFRDASAPHHRFRLADTEHELEISDSIEVHTVELMKYNLSETTISEASAIEQWAFFFLFADRYEPKRLRELLPGVEFQQAIAVIEAIAAKTEDRLMYDQREKAQRDYQWGLDSARQEGWEGGELAGKIQILQQLLGEESSSTESLRERTIGELSQILADLQQRLRFRDA